jgi:putative membrane protein
MLSPSDIQRIEQAIAAAERHTHGEIVVVEVERSSDYLTFRLKAAILALALAEATLAFVELRGPWLPGYQLMAVQWSVAALVFGLLGRPAILRRLLPKRLRNRKVHARAMEKFLEHNVHATREQTGVLVLLSCLEHRVEILVDRGCLRVPQDFWNAQVEVIARGIRSGQPGAAIVQAIGAIGEALATHLPSGPGGNRNELGNEVRR